MPSIFSSFSFCNFLKHINAINDTVDPGYSEPPRDGQNWFTAAGVLYNRSNLHSKGLEGLSNVVHSTRKFTLNRIHYNLRLQ